MGKLPVIPLLVLATTVAAAAAGWHFRQPLGRQMLQAFTRLQVAPQTAAARRRLEAAGMGETLPPAAAQRREETVYRWVDANGVTHFDQAGGAGRRAVAVAPDNVSPLNTEHLTGRRTGEHHTD